MMWRATRGSFLWGENVAVGARMWSAGEDGTGGLNLSYISPRSKSYISPRPTKKLYLATARSTEKATSLLAQPEKPHLVWPDQKSYNLPPCSTKKATSCLAEKATSRLAQGKKAISRHRARPKKLYLVSPNRKSCIPFGPTK